MKINGYKIRETLKIKGIQLQTLLSTFKDSLYAYPDEKDLETKDPKTIMDKAIKIEQDIATLQTAQKFYNINNTVELPQFGTQSLEFAIKVVGSFGRYSKKFRDVAKGTEERGYYRESGPKKRSKEDVYQEETITKTSAMELATDSEKTAAMIRSIIAQANSIEIDVPFVTEDLF